MCTPSGARFAAIPSSPNVMWLSAASSETILKTILQKDESSFTDEHEPRTDLCKAACKLGKQLKMPVYVFLKEAIIRKYGEEFFEALEATAKQMQQEEI